MAYMLAVLEILRDFFCISIYYTLLFIFECFHDKQHTQWRYKASQKYQTRKSPEGQNIFLSSSSSSSSDRLVQICVTLSRWFLHKTAAFSTEQCTSPSLFFRFEVSRGVSNRSLKNYGFLCDAIFFLHVYACTQIT